jgi:hypothetical protein
VVIEAVLDANVKQGDLISYKVEAWSSTSFGLRTSKTLKA